MEMVRNSAELGLAPPGAAAGVSAIPGRRRPGAGGPLVAPARPATLRTGAALRARTPRR